MRTIPFILGAASGAGQLQSIQSGTAIIPNGSSSVNVTIAAISNLNKGWLRFQYDSQQDWDDPADCMVRGKINTTTQLQFFKSGTSGNINIRWWVIEFTAGSGVTVQRGSQTFSTPIHNVSISAVNLSNSFADISYSSPGISLDQNHFITADLTTTTNLQLQAFGSVGQVVEWQVVENPTWNVSKYNDTLTGTVLNTTISAIVLAESFLISSGRFSSSVSIPGDALFRCRFTSTTNIQAVRVGSPSNSPIVYFVVSHSAISAQHLQYTITNGNLTATQAISAVTLANSFLIATGINRSHALNTSNGNNQGGRLCVNHTFNSTTQIQGTRQVSTDNANFNVSAIDFTSV